MVMNRKVLHLLIMTTLLTCSITAEAQAYRLTSVSRSRLLVDSTLDLFTDSTAMKYLIPYKQRVDSLILPVVGNSAQYMCASRPESLLSNLLSDIMIYESSRFGEKIDFAVYNIGGIRASLPKGKVTYGDILDIAPFENKLCFLTLTGQKVLQLFQEIALTGGEGVSHGAHMVITKQGKLLSVLLNGKKIILTKKYRVATLDYLAQGNDNMEAFKSSINVVVPTNSNNMRELIIKYFRDCMKQGVIVNSRMEGRITVK
jgi:2',3'-cyclic-nucleotide 2'-phosphodiesterase (5'-nucleotidase family)